MPRPRIGVTVDWDDAARVVTPRVSGEGAYFLFSAYADAIARAGGTPVLIPSLSEPEAVHSVADMVHGVVITGGDFDIDPATYGAASSPALGRVIASRTRSERMLIDEALRRRLPVLAICGGEQLLNVVRGGTLVQDIPTEVANALEHEQSAPKDTPTHDVTLAEGGILHLAFDATTVAVNTTHHQAVKDVGAGLTVTATAPDGVIEGIELTDYPFCVGVQWHPEILARTDAGHQKLFRLFVNACLD